jgi:hypothetical protein
LFLIFDWCLNLNYFTLLIFIFRAIWKNIQFLSDEFINTLIWRSDLINKLIEINKFEFTSALFCFPFYILITWLVELDLVLKLLLLLDVFFYIDSKTLSMPAIQYLFRSDVSHWSLRHFTLVVFNQVLLGRYCHVSLDKLRITSEFFIQLFARLLIYIER